METVNSRQTKYPVIPDYIRKQMESGEEDKIKLDAEGKWFHNGKPFLNKKIIDFFNRSIDITEDGIYVVSYSDYVHPIVVEDVPVFINGIMIDYKDTDKESVQIALSSGQVEILDVSTLYFKDNALYCRVMNGKFPAKFKRSPCYELLSRVEEDEKCYYINLCTRKIVLSEK